MQTTKAAMTLRHRFVPSPYPLRQKTVKQPVNSRSGYGAGTVRLRTLFFAVMGMVGGDSVAESIARQVCINLCSADTFMAKHLLDST